MNFAFEFAILNKVETPAVSFDVCLESFQSNSKGFGNDEAWSEV